MTWLDTYEKQVRDDYTGTRFESWIPGIVENEARGIAASERVGDTWCRCGDTTDQESYYRKPVKGTHGFFHDPALGGCGGITQTG